VSINNPFRRAEIIRIAQRKGVADTADLDRFLIAWFWHRPLSAHRNPTTSLVDIAWRMGRGDLAVSDAAELVAASARGRPLYKADDLGAYLRLTDAERTAWRIRTIGGHDFSRRRRTIRRKQQDRERKARQRLAAGAHPQSRSLSKLKPWEARNMSRRSWYRRQKKDERPTEKEPPKLKLVHSSNRPTRLAWMLRADARGVRAVQIRVPVNG
jgi:hypothetical protein